MSLGQAIDEIVRICLTRVLPILVYVFRIEGLIALCVCAEEQSIRVEQKDKGRHAKGFFVGLGVCRRAYFRIYGAKKYIMKVVLIDQLVLYM